jgi:hypothetical protein
LGGYWLTDAIVHLAREGHCFDGELANGYWEQLYAWGETHGHWTPEFLNEKCQDYRFALDFVRSNVSPEFLYHQFQEAQSGVDGGYCLGSDIERGQCLGCGACIGAEQRASIVEHRIQGPERGTRLGDLRDLMRRKNQLKRLYVRVRVPPSLAGVRPAFLNAALQQAWLAQYPEWTDNLLAVDESLFSLRPNNQRFPPLTGETVFGVKAWNTAALAEVFDRHPSPTSTPSTFRALGLAEDFVPGVYTRLGLDLSLPARHFAEPRVHLEQYLRDAYLPYSLRRIPCPKEDEACYSFDVPQKGLRKKILWAGTFSLGEAGMEAHLEIGPGFDLSVFLGTFYERARYHAQAHITRVEW